MVKKRVQTMVESYPQRANEAENEKEIGIERISMEKKEREKR